MVSVGSMWTKRRNITTEIPMTIDHTYTVKELDSKTAKIDIMGTITPLSTVGETSSNKKDVQLDVRSGDSYGYCILDLKTGLPLESHLDQFVDMQVTLEGGIKFDQRKRIVTKIRSYLPQESSGPIVNSTDNKIKATPVSDGPKLFELK